MFFLKVILVTSALVASLVSASAQEIIMNVQDYRTSLGRFLVAKVDSNDVVSNIVEAYNWKEYIGPGVEVRPEFLKLHRDFLLLKDLNEGQYCDPSIAKTIEPLKDLSEMAGKFKALSFEVNYRLDAVIKEALRNHARRCLPTIMEAVKKLKGQLDPELLKGVANLNEGLREDLKTRTYGANPILVFSPTGSMIASSAYKSLIGHFEDRSIKIVLPNSKGSSVSQKKVRELYRKYISDPCQAFVEKLKAEMDFIEFETDLLIGYANEQPLDEKFRETVFEYKTCLALKDELEGGEEAIFNRFKMEVKDQSGRKVKKDSLLRRLIS